MGHLVAQEFSKENWINQMADTQRQTRMYWLHALSGVHVGAGAGVGLVDLPIIREKVTEWPYIPGTSVKGVLAAFHNADEDQRRPKTLARAAFGVADNDKEEGNNSGALIFTDARLVCLPIASFFGTFAWTTSWLALRRLARDLQAAGLPQIPSVPAESGDTAAVTEDCALAEGPLNRQVYLGDFDFATQVSEPVEKWAQFLAQYFFPGDEAWIREFKRRFIILPEQQFTHFARYGCEVVPRIKISPGTRTVTGTALWLEETLPAESLLAGVVICERLFVPGTQFTVENVVSTYCKKDELMQFGGKATTGRGRVQLRFSGGKA